MLPEGYPRWLLYSDIDRSALRHFRLSRVDSEGLKTAKDGQHPSLRADPVSLLQSSQLCCFLGDLAVEELETQ